MGDLANLADLLPTYYRRLFPFFEYYRWLSYGNSDVFARREFSFTLEDDIYIRFQSFKDHKELEAEIKRLNPFKIDIGAVYNARPKDKRRFPNFQPVERELLFDIDMTDYDDVRTCCSGTDICAKCWKYMVLACKILDAALRDDFNFNHILWVFSGRRGIHCWVCDDSARVLDVDVRSSVAEYLQLVTGGEFKKKKVILTGDRLHPSVRRAIRIIEPVFTQLCVEDQQMLGKEEDISKFLATFTDEIDRKEVKKLFDQCSTSVERWDAFVDYMKNQKHAGSRKRKQRHIIEEIMLQYAYPRLDINVTKGINHLLKSPFCVHPKTGKVCIPFNPKSVEKFNLDTVPTIMTLIDEINAYDVKAEEQEQCSSAKRIKDYKKTSLNKSLHIFQEFLRGLEDSRKGKRIIESDMKMEF